MRAGDVPFRDTRIVELRRLDRCERALAYAYRWQAQHDGVEADMLQRFATLHEGNAALLRGRIFALGGRPDAEPTTLDEEWLIGPVEERETLRRAEQAALDTYHDHLSDFDPDTAMLVRDVILPAVRLARDYHERDEVMARISDI